jgi:hypothetical protein
MDREFRIAAILVGLIAAWVIALVLLVRYAVPMVLEARFTGCHVRRRPHRHGRRAGLVWAASRIFCWARAAFRR